MGVKSTRVATISGSGYSGDTKAATIAVRSGLTVAITDTTYYSDIANYVEPSQYMNSGDQYTHWTITSAKTVNQMFTQWKVSPAVTITSTEPRKVTFNVKNNLSIPINISYRADVTDGEIRDVTFVTPVNTLSAGATLSPSYSDGLAPNLD